MKNALIISLIALILLLGGAWLYLLLNGAPKNIPSFGNLFGKATTVVNTPTNSEQITPSTTEETSPDRTINVRQELVKLTERSTAGAIITSHQNASTTEENVIRYMTKGTGYIYDISLITGVEKRISGRTIPQVVEALWSPKGNAAILTTDVNGVQGEKSLLLFSTGETGEVSTTLEGLSSIENASFDTEGNILFYTEKTTEGTVGFARNLTTGATEQLFSVPFKESRVLWDVWEKHTHYIYTKPGLGFMGYLYQITPSGLKKIDSAKTLSASRIDANTLIINKDSGKGPYSLLLTADGRDEFLNIETLSEKCAGYGAMIWCGATEGAGNSSFPLAWYEGTVSYADALWSITTTNGVSKKVADPEALSREQIDVTDMQTAPGGLLFKNKRDDSLWLYNFPR